MQNKTGFETTTRIPRVLDDDIGTECAIPPGARPVLEGTAGATAAGMTNQHATWEDIKRLTNEVELQIHLAGMDARDRWRALKPRIDRLEASLARAGSVAKDAVVRELDEVRAALDALRDETKH